MKITPEQYLRKLLQQCQVSINTAAAESPLSKDQDPLIPEPQRSIVTKLNGCTLTVTGTTTQECAEQMQQIGALLTYDG